MQVQVRDHAIDRRHHPRPLQIQRRALARAHRFGQRRLRRLHLGDILLMGFRRHQIAQRQVAPRLPPRLPQHRLRAGNLRPRLLQRQMVARRVDHEQQVARLHPLIVAHRDGGDETAYVRRHAHHIGPHPPVAGPGAALIMGPHPYRHDHSGNDDQYGGKAAQQRSGQAVHSEYPVWGKRKDKAPKISTNRPRSTAAR